MWVTGKDCHNEPRGEHGPRRHTLPGARQRSLPWCVAGRQDYRRRRCRYRRTSPAPTPGVHVLTTQRASQPRRAVTSGSRREPPITGPASLRLLYPVWLTGGPRCSGPTYCAEPLVMRSRRGGLFGICLELGSVRRPPLIRRLAEKFTRKP